MKHSSDILLFLLNRLWSQMCKVLNENRAKCCRLSLNGCIEPFKQHVVAEVLNLISLGLTKNNHFTWHKKGLRFLTAHDCFPPSPWFCCFCCWMIIHISPTSCRFCDELFWSTWVINLFPTGILLSRTITKPFLANQQTGCTDPSQ